MGAAGTRSVVDFVRCSAAQQIAIADSGKKGGNARARSGRLEQAERPRMRRTPSLTENAGTLSEPPQAGP